MNSKIIMDENCLDYTPYAEIPDDEQEELALPTRVETLTVEINIYKAQAGAAIIEIGRRLTEAKDLLEHGQWLPWLQDRVEFSESAAQRFMRLAKEYSNPSALTDLGATKALALLALPSVERDDFIAATHVVDGQEKAVEDMTTRELEKVIRERDEAMRAKKEAEENFQAEWDKNEEIGFKIEELREKEAVSQENLEKAKEAADKKEKELSQKLLEYLAEQGKLQEQLTKAKEAKKKAEEKYKALKDDPAADPEILAKLKVEAEQAVKAEAEAAAAEKLKAIETDRDRLAAEKEAAGAAKAEAESKIAELEKRLAMAEPAVKEFQVYFAQLQETYNKMTGLLAKIEQENPEMSVKLHMALKTAMNALAEKAGA